MIMNWDDLPKTCKFCGDEISWFGAGYSLYCLDVEKKEGIKHNCRSKNPERIPLTDIFELEHYFFEDLKGNLKIIKAGVE